MSLRNVYRRVISKLILSAIDAEGLAKALGLETTDLIVQKLLAIIQEHETDTILKSVLSPLMIELGKKHKALLDHSDFDTDISHVIKWFKDNIKTEEDLKKFNSAIKHKHGSKESLSSLIVKQFFIKPSVTVLNDLFKYDLESVKKGILLFKDFLLRDFYKYKVFINNMIEFLLSIKDVDEMKKTLEFYKQDEHLVKALSSFNETSKAILNSIVQNEYSNNVNFAYFVDRHLNDEDDEEDFYSFSQLESIIKENPLLEEIYQKALKIQAEDVKEIDNINTLEDLQKLISNIVNKHGITVNIEHRFQDRQHNETGKKVGEGDVISRIGVGSDIVNKYGLKESNKVLDKNGDLLVQKGSGKLVLLLQEEINVNCNIINGFVNSGVQYCVLQKGSGFFDTSSYPSPYIVVFLETTNGKEFVRRIIGLISPTTIFSDEINSFDNEKNNGTMNDNLKNIIMSDEKVLNFINSHFNQSNGKYYQKTKKNFNFKEGSHDHWIDLFASKYQNGLCNEMKNLTGEQIIDMIEKKEVGLDAISDNMKNKIDKNVWLKWVDEAKNLERKIKILENMTEKLAIDLGNDFWIDLVNKSKSIEDKVDILKNIPAKLAIDFGDDFWIGLVNDAETYEDKNSVLIHIPEEVQKSIDSKFWISLVDEAKTNDDKYSILSGIKEEVKNTIDSKFWIDLVDKAKTYNNKGYMLNYIPEEVKNKIDKNIWIRWVNDAKTDDDEYIVLSKIPKKAENQIDIDVWIGWIDEYINNDKYSIFLYVPDNVINTIDKNTWIRWANNAKNIENKYYLLKKIPYEVKETINSNFWIGWINEFETNKYKLQILEVAPPSIRSQFDKKGNLIQPGVKTSSVLSRVANRVYLKMLVSDDLVDEHELVGVPDVRQDDINSCGVASVQAVLAYYGIDKRVDELKKMLKTDDHGTTPEHLIATLKKFKLKVDSSLKTVEELKEIVKRDIPVIVDIQAWPEHTTDLKRDYEDGHYVVLMGLTDDSFIIEDPAMFGRVKIRFDEFVTRWHDKEDDGEVETHLSIVISGHERADSTIHDLEELEKKDLSN